MEEPQKIDIFSYLDPQSYLKDWYSDFRKRKGSKASMMACARQLQLSSKSHFHRVLNDARMPISFALVQRLSVWMELNKKESEYFKLLCMFKREKCQKERVLLLETILNIQKSMNPQYSSVETSTYFRDHRFPILREWIVQKDHSKNFEEIGKYIHPPMSRKEVQTAKFYD